MRYPFRAKDSVACVDKQDMKQGDDNHIGDTIRIRRPSKVYTDELGNSIWMSEVDPCTLELEQQLSTDPYNNSPVAAARYNNK